MREYYFILYNHQYVTVLAESEEMAKAVFSIRHPNNELNEGQDLMIKPKYLKEQESIAQND